MNYFSQPKAARELKPANEIRPDAPAPAPAAAPRSAPRSDVVSTFGHGMVITGNIVCAGALQIFGR